MIMFETCVIGQTFVGKEASGDLPDFNEANGSTS